RLASPAAAARTATFIDSPRRRLRLAPPRDLTRDAVGSLADDLALHRAQQAEQLALLLRADLMLVERPHQVLDGRVPLAVGDLHASVRRLHVAPEVGAGAAGGVADLVGEVRPELEDRGGRHALEAIVHARVGDHRSEEHTSELQSRSDL